MNDLTSKCEHFAIVMEWSYVVIFAFKSKLFQWDFFGNEVSKEFNRQNDETPAIAAF